MTTPHNDRNLLFGIVALQFDFVTRDQLVAATSVWMADKQKSLAEILVAQGALSMSRRGMLEPLVEEHLRQHGNDPQKCLAALSSVDDARSALASLQDPDIFATLAHLKPPLDAPATAAPSLNDPSSRFRILRHHAKGGLGVVFVAHDREINRQVALKEIQLERAHDAEARSRFVLEAEITGGLEHPGIVPVYGLGHYPDGRPYYAMRFIKGDSLKEAADAFHQADKDNPRRDTTERNLALRELLRRFIDVCNAIDYAHSKGVLHRDLKPGNIMLGKYGETLVVDWGLAKSLATKDSLSTATQLDEPPLVLKSDSQSEPTQMGSALGTPAFMSPEQAAGRLDLLGPVSDVYSLGATLYYVLTGRPPFEDLDVVYLLESVQKGLFSPPCRIKPSIDKPLEAVCIKAMSCERKDRYETAAALRKDLENWIADAPVNAWREPLRIKARRWMSKRKKLVVSLAVFVLVVTLTLLGGEYWLTVRLTDQNDFAFRLLYDSKIQLAHREWQIGQVQAAMDLLNETPNELRGWEHAYLTRVCHGADWTFWGHSGEVNCVAFSPDGRYLASGSNRSPRFNASFGEVKIWDALTGQELVTLGDDEPIYDLTFSPDGMRLAGVYGGRGLLSGFGRGTKQWDVNKWKNTLNPSEGSLEYESIRCVSFSPDSKRLATKSVSHVILQETQTGKELFSVKQKEDGGTLQKVAFTSDGKRLVCAYNKSVHFLDASTAQVLSTFENIGGSCLAVSPDGKHLATAYGSFAPVSSGDMKVKVIDALTGKQTLALDGHKGGTLSVAFSPDGQFVASGGWDNNVRVWDALTGTEIHVFKGHTKEVCCVAFSPDGRRLASASADRTVKVWDLLAWQEPLRLNGHKDAVNALVFSFNGTHLASAGADGTVRIWSALTGQELIPLKSLKGEATSVSFSSDGKQLVGGFRGRIDSPGEVKVWEVVTGHELFALQGILGQIQSVAFSPDGKYVAAHDEGNPADNQANMIAGKPPGGAIRVWDAKTGREISEMKLGFDLSGSVVFGRDGNRLHYGNRLYSGGKEWDTRTWLEVKSSRTLSPFPWYSPDGKYRAAGDLHDSVVYDSLSGNLVHRLKGYSGKVNCVVFSPDGKRIVSGSGGNEAGKGFIEGQLNLWDAKTGQEILGLERGPAVVSVAFSPDGRRLASAGTDGVITVWDARIGQEIRIKGDQGSQFFRCDGVALSPDRTRLAIVSDSSIIMWDAKSGQELYSFGVHESFVERVVFSQDSKQLVATDKNGVMFMCDVNTGWNRIKMPQSSRGRRLNIPQSATILSAYVEATYDDSKRGIRLIVLSAEEMEMRRRLSLPNRTWHQDAFQKAEKDQRWVAALFHLNKLVLLESAPAEVAALTAKRSRIREEAIKRDPTAFDLAPLP